MSIRLMFIWCMAMLPTILLGQDLVLMAEDETVQGRIVDIKGNHIVVEIAGEGESITQRIPKHQIRLVRYEDGMEQYFSVKNSPQPEVPTIDSVVIILDSTQQIWANLSELDGLVAAEMEYTGKGPFWGTFGATVFYPFFGLFTGLATAGVVSLTPANPKLELMEVPEKYEQNPQYAEGYRRGVKRKKARKAFKGFLVGVGTQAAVIITFLILITR